MLKTVSSSDSIEVRLVVDRFPYKWKLFEIDASGSPILIGDGLNDTRHLIGVVPDATTRVFIWSFVVVSQDPDTTVTVTGEAYANSALVKPSIEGQFTVKKPTTTKFFQLELTGRA